MHTTQVSWLIRTNLVVIGLGVLETSMPSVLGSEKKEKKEQNNEKVIEK